MDFVEATITSKGQVTVPKKIRQQLELKTGSKVVFIPREREVVMKKQPKDAFKELLKLRERVPKFTEKELRQLMKEDKAGWSKL